MTSMFALAIDPIAVLSGRLLSLRAWWALPLRLIVGYGFFAHGQAKLGRGPEHFTHILDALGMPAPAFMARMTILVEVLGGLAVIAGLFVPVAAAPMAIILTVAILTVHLPNGFSSIKLQEVTAAGAHFGQPGYETDLLYLAALAALVIGGSGPLSLDRLLLRRLQRGGDASCESPGARADARCASARSTRSFRNPT